MEEVNRVRKAVEVQTVGPVGRPAVRAQPLLPLRLRVGSAQAGSSGSSNCKPAPRLKKALIPSKEILELVLQPIFFNVDV